MTFARNDEGLIHDHVTARWSDGTERFSVTVIAGDDADDTIGLQLHPAGISVSTLLRADEAAALGRLLIAASEDTLSRPRAPTDAGTEEGDVP